MIRIYLIVLLLFFVGQLASQTVIAQYNFSGDATDNIGTNDGIIHNAILTEDRNGIPNSAYHFNGLDAYIEVQDYTIFNFGLDDFAVSFWMKTNSLDPKGTMFQKGSKYSSNSPQFWVRTNDNINNNIIAFLTSDGNPPSPYAGSDTVSILDDEWHHILIQRDEKFLQIHIDCQMVANNYDIYRDVSDDVGLIIGAQHPHPGSSLISNYFNGSLDDFRIYHEALTVLEIQALCTDETIDVVDVKKDLNINIFPNPSLGTVTIAGNEIEKIIIFSSEGKLVNYINTPKNKNIIDLSKEAKGVYFVKLISQNNAVVQKIIIE